MENIHIITEFLDIWFQTRRSQDLCASSLAGVIQGIYDASPGDGAWALVSLRPTELRDYITTYLKNGVMQKAVIAEKDVKLYAKYASLLRQGYMPTPVIIAGAEDDCKTQGIYLIDGRRRIYSACIAEKKTMKAYIPVKDLEMLKKANL